jgi:hypothetical protein
VLTIVIAAVHLTLEAAFIIKIGQTFTGYLPDLIVVTLLLVGGYLTIKNPNAVGILCGAWGFACCLHYRSWAWRFNDVMEGTSTELVETTMTVLAVTMPISVIAFGVTLTACLPKHRRH